MRLQLSGTETVGIDETPHAPPLRRLSEQPNNELTLFTVSVAVQTSAWRFWTEAVFSATLREAASE